MLKCRKKKIERKKKKSNKKKNLIQILISRIKMKSQMMKKLYYCKWSKSLKKTNKLNKMVVQNIFNKIMMIYKFSRFHKEKNKK